MVAMRLPEPDNVIGALERGRARVVLVAAGGGSAALSHLATTPGASAVVAEGLLPSAREAVDRLLGGPQETYCSSRTARRLAVAAWQRARDCGATAEEAVGAAVTASLRTRRPKRGSHRIHVAVQTLAATATADLVLEKDARSRADEEGIAAALVIDELLAACGAASAAVGMEEAGLRDTERVRRERYQPPPAWRHLLAGAGGPVLAEGGGAARPAQEPATGRLIFPGSFDPLHEAHLLMARIAEEIAERPIEYEISVTNVDKPALDYIEIRDRAAQFVGRPLWLTSVATFIEKLEAFPRSTFVMGVDTYVRLADPRYYGGSTDAAADAVRTIAERAAGLIVFGRAKDGEFLEASRLVMPQALRGVTYFVSQREFRLDLSSTELRRRERERREAECDG
jgi:hypothetical protein